MAGGQATPSSAFAATRSIGRTRIGRRARCPVLRSSLPLRTVNVGRHVVSVVATDRRGATCQTEFTFNQTLSFEQLKVGLVRRRMSSGEKIVRGKHLDSQALAAGFSRIDIWIWRP